MSIFHRYPSTPGPQKNLPENILEPVINFLTNACPKNWTLPEKYGYHLCDTKLDHSSFFHIEVVNSNCLFRQILSAYFTCL